MLTILSKCIKTMFCFEHLFEDESWFQQVLEEVFVKNFCTSALESNDKQDEESIAINSDLTEYQACLLQYATAVFY